MNDKQTHAAALMMIEGRLGSFAEHIGRAFIAASPANRERLFQAFPEVFQAAQALTFPTLRSV